MVSEKKKENVQLLVKHIHEYPMIGVINLENLPAQQFQKMRKSLMKNDVIISVNRKRLLSRALSASKKAGVEELNGKLTGMPALLFSKGNPFALYATLQKSKSQAPAKAGQKAPRDIVVKAGPTNFAPGPIISELAAVGIKTKVENGKLAVISDTTIVHEGAEITGKVAETLKRLDIQPMEIGLNLVAVLEDGFVYEAKHLRVDEDEYRNNFTTAAQEAMNLAVETVYLFSETTDIIIQKAFREAKAVGVEQNIMTEDTRDAILAKAEAQANSVKEEAHL